MGTLKVTCSKLGISLRRPKPRSDNGPLRLKAVTRMAGASTATFTIVVRHHGDERRIEVPLTPAMIGRLALEASSQDPGFAQPKQLVRTSSVKGSSSNSLARVWSKSSSHCS